MLNRHMLRSVVPPYIKGCRPVKRLTQTLDGVQELDHVIVAIIQL